MGVVADDALEGMLRAVAAEPMAQPAQPGLSASRGEAPAAPRAMPSAREAQDIPDRPAPEVTTKSGD